MNIEELRKKIDKIDDSMLNLFEKRLSLMTDILKFKLKNNLDIVDDVREKNKLDMINSISTDENRELNRKFFINLMQLCKEKQKDIYNNFF